MRELHNLPVVVELYPDEMDCTELGEAAAQEFALAALVAKGRFTVRNFYRRPAR
jgi:hypothetical protein